MLGAKLSLIARWGAINMAFFFVAFLGTALLIQLAPETMLALFARYASLLESLGAKGASEFSSQSGMFLHILQRNTIAAVLYFAIGLLLQAPVAVVFSGAFYSFVTFLAPLTLGRPFALADWFLVLVEALALLLAASLSSALAGERHAVAPSIRAWWGFSKKSWRSLRGTKAATSWEALLPAWAPASALSLMIIAALLVSVAWFEVYGY
jgi:hypothetical protein